MKINWKILIALASIVGVSYWVVDSIVPRSYSGSTLNFEVGRGAVTITNPSSESVSVQFVDGSHSFRVSSTTGGLSGSSTRQGSGNSAINSFGFELPPGESEFLITRGTDVNFVAATTTSLEATMRPVNASSARTIVAVAALVILGCLFYISHALKHRWIHIFRRQNTAVSILTPVVETAAAGQRPAYRPYGDNRADR